jgi:hypothetical protein
LLALVSKITECAIGAALVLLRLVGSNELAAHLAAGTSLPGQGFEASEPYRKNASRGTTAVLVLSQVVLGIAAVVLKTHLASTISLASADLLWMACVLQAAGLLPCVSVAEASAERGAFEQALQTVGLSR